MVSIQEWLYSGIVDPVETSSIGVCLKPLPHSEEEGVGKKADQKFFRISNFWRFHLLSSKGLITGQPEIGCICNGF